MSSRVETIAAGSLCGVIALVPLPFGSTSPKVIAFWVLILGVTAAIASLRPLGSRDLLFLSGVALVSICWGVVVATQLGYGTIATEDLIDPVWQRAASILGNGSSGTISVARDQPIFSVGSQIACMLSLLCGFLVGRNRDMAQLLLMTFAVSGLGYAIYGIIAFTFWPDHLLWQIKTNYLNALVGTFFNPNVAAVYFGACTVVWALVFSKTIQNEAAKHPAPWRHLVEVFFRNRRPVLSFLGLLTVLSALIMTGSRAGIVLSLLAICGAVVTSYRRMLSKRGFLFAVPLSLCAIIVFIQFFGGRVNDRLGAQGFVDLARWHTYVSTLQIIEDHPWIGTGLGTFRWIFPKYRSESVSITGIWEQAHSTTLEIASEMGIPLTVLFGLGWMFILASLGVGMVTRKRDQIFATAAFWISLLALIHSQIDFSLQVPGFAIVVFTFIGMGFAQTTSSGRRVNLTNN